MQMKKEVSASVDMTAEWGAAEWRVIDSLWIMAMVSNDTVNSGGDGCSLPLFTV
jgi:hypothetical protein